MSAVLRGPFGRLTLGSTPLTIGYTTNNELVINNPQASSIFMIVNASGQDAMLTPLGNVQPIFVNGQRLEPHQPYRLYPGAGIRVGETMFTYEEDISAGNSTPIPPVSPSYNATPSWNQYPGMDSNVPQTPPSPTPFASQSSQPSGIWAGNPPSQPSGAWAGNPPSQPSGAWAGNPPSQPSGAWAGNQLGQQANIPGSPVASAPQNNTAFTLVLIGLIVLIVLVAGGSSFAIYQLTRPQPIIAVSSPYMSGKIPMGAAGTNLHMLGYKFSSNVPITVLLDNNPLPGQPGIHSDADGNFTANLSITPDWSTGNHQLTAKETDGSPAKNDSTITIVKPGESDIPGPNGIPPNEANFTLKINATIPGSNPITGILSVIGQPGTDSGKVCDLVSDTNQPQTSNGVTNDGTTYVSTSTLTCSGTYKDGKFDYTESLANDKIVYANGITCQLATSPTTFVKLSGTFNSATGATGTYARPGIAFTCDKGASLPSSPDASGPMTATIFGLSAAT